VTVLNDIADAIETRVEELTSMRLYSEPDKAADADIGGVAAELFLNDRRQFDNCSQVAEWELRLSVPAEQPDWSGSFRRLRQYADHSGTYSVEAKLQESPKNLGESGLTNMFVNVGREGRVKYNDGDRWVVPVYIRTVYS